MTNNGRKLGAVTPDRERNQANVAADLDGQSGKRQRVAHLYPTFGRVVLAPAGTVQGALYPGRQGKPSSSRRIAVAAPTLFREADFESFRLAVIQRRTTSRSFHGRNYARTNND